MVKIVEGFARLVAVPAGTSPKSGVQFFDDELPGFGVRKFPNGKASYFVKCNVGAQQRRQTLGSALERGGLKDARNEARRILLKARVGEDIVAERRAEAKAKVAVKTTLGGLVPEYLEACKSRLRPSTLGETRRYLTRSWAPLHNREITSINRSAVLDVIETLARDSGARASDCAKATLSGLFVWAMDHRERYAEVNPTVGIKRRAAGNSRERVLSDDEIRTIWRAAGDDGYGKILKLLILTGQRKSEIGGLAWAEIDIGRRQIELPAERTKNARRHVVPLSDEALGQLPARRDGHAHLFGSRPGASFSDWSRARAELDGRIAAVSRKGKPLPHWTIHDIRRTCATGLQKLGVRLEVTESVLGHVSGSRAGIISVYQKYKFTDEAREALEAWARYVMGIVR